MVIPLCSLPLLRIATFQPFTTKSFATAVISMNTPTLKEACSTIRSDLQSYLGNHLACYQKRYDRTWKCNLKDSSSGKPLKIRKVRVCQSVQQEVRVVSLKTFFTRDQFLVLKWSRWQIRGSGFPVLKTVLSSQWQQCEYKAYILYPKRIQIRKCLFFGPASDDPWTRTGQGTKGTGGRNHGLGFMDATRLFRSIPIKSFDFGCGDIPCLYIIFALPFSASWKKNELFIGKLKTIPQNKTCA